MKREEMIDLILDNASFDFEEMPLLQADRILTLLESNGMKPPRLPEEMCQAMYTIYISPPVHMWEHQFFRDHPKAVEVYEKRKKKCSKT